MATITDIAREAGVSTSTVSHVVNGTRYVSPDLRARVEAAMQLLGYRPNALARGLRRGRTQAIGLMVPDNSNPFFAEIARAIEDRGFETGHSVILCNTDNRMDKEEAYIDVLLAKQVDGIIYIASRDDAGRHVHELVETGVPFVIADRDLPDGGTTAILVDNEQGGFDATEHLISLGHRRIACIAGPMDLRPSQERTQGFRRALREAGLDADAARVVEAQFRVSGGEQAMRELLASDPRPTAVFACNDMMAIGAIRAARAAGYRVPSDASVVGFDDVSLAELIDPPLTTVAQPIQELARLAIDELIRQIHASHGDGERASQQKLVLKARLVIRESTAPPPQPS